MSPKLKRKMLDAAITIPLMFVVWYWAAWWVPLLMFPWGIWNYYDGMTRLQLADNESA